ncbi:MAG: Smr/MutS family protein [Bacteroidetes bacterium]|jgi:hypothetical protein|nr:Smr/MutS family protein [Bacteroidota bacterium]
MKVGDKVSFVNEKLNGVIKAVKPGGIIAVEIEDDFIIDALEKDVVVTEVFIKNHSAETTEIKKVESTEAEFALHTNEIDFVAIPAEKHKVLTGYVSYYLINGTDNDLQYLFYSRSDSGVQLKSSGALSAHNKVNVLTINRPDITDISSFLIQLLISGGNIVHHPVQKEMAVMLPDLSLKNKNYPDFTAVTSILNFNQPDDSALIKLKELFEPEIKTGATNKKTKDNRASKNSQAILLNYDEIDLHIEKLTDNSHLMSNFEMLELQKSVVRQEMDKAIRKHYKKIVFIHGKGEGVLKNEVLKELSVYNDIEIREADYSRFGGGATEVIF